MNYKKERNSNIELLRILCMLILIIHHCVLHGGAVNMDLCSNREIAIFFVPAGKIAFDAFVAISMYFLVDQDFRTNKFVKTWFLVLFYSVAFAFLACAFGVSVSRKEILASFFPIIGNAHGFASAYLAFYLLLPILRKTRSMSKFQLQWLIAVLTICEIGTQMMGSITEYYQILYSELLLFVLCYYVSLYLKEFPLKICSSKFFLCLIIILVYALRLSLMYITTDSVILQKIVFFVSMNIGDESSIFNIIAGYALFYLFLNIRMKSSKVINTLAIGAFPVLLIHDHNIFRHVIWRLVFKTQEWYYDSFFILRLLLVCICIYVFGFILEIMRKNILEKPLLRLNIITQVCEKIDAKLISNSSGESLS